MIRWARANLFSSPINAVLTIAALCILWLVVPPLIDWAFIDAHYAKAPENFCFDGVDVTAPDAGIPADCGQAPDAGDAGGG